MGQQQAFVRNYPTNDLRVMAGLNGLSLITVEAVQQNEGRICNRWLSCLSVYLFHFETWSLEGKNEASDCTCVGKACDTSFLSSSI